MRRDGLLRGSCCRREAHMLTGHQGSVPWRPTGQSPLSWPCPGPRCPSAQKFGWIIDRDTKRRRGYILPRDLFSSPPFSTASLDKTSLVALLLHIAYLLLPAPRNCLSRRIGPTSSPTSETHLHFLFPRLEPRQESVERGTTPVIVGSHKLPSSPRGLG